MNVHYLDGAFLCFHAKAMTSWMDWDDRMREMVKGNWHITSVIVSVILIFISVKMSHWTNSVT